MHYAMAFQEMPFQHHLIKLGFIDSQTRAYSGRESFANKQLELLGFLWGNICFAEEGKTVLSGA